MTKEQDKQLIKKICDQVLDGSLNIKDFDHLWLRVPKDEPLFTAIREDLENAIEHTPGYWLKRGVDQKTWQKSGLYLRVFVDSLLLDRDESPDELLRCRNLLLKNHLHSKEKIEEEVVKCLKSGPQSKSKR